MQHGDFYSIGVWGRVVSGGVPGKRVYVGNNPGLQNCEEERRTARTVEPEISGGQLQGRPPNASNQRIRGGQKPRH